MVDWSLAPFDNPCWHTAVGDIIRRVSTNRTDVREFALDGLDLARMQEILDLGCGFGFMTEAVAGRVAPAARILGVDACPTNEQPFLERITGARRRGRFVCQRLDTRLDWPDGAFDLVVASYSLYFFPDVIPEVARILAPAGLFVALTHMEASCRDLLRVVGLRATRSPLLPISRGFSGENGGRLLAPWFGEVERVDYENSLVFEAAEHDDLLTYLRFKLPFLSPGSEPGGELPEPLWNAVQAHLSRQQRVVLGKNDAVFRCRKPRCP